MTVDNGMFVGAQDEWDRRGEAYEYRNQWVQTRAEGIVDDLKEGYGIAYEVDAVDLLGKVLTLHMQGKHDEIHDELSNAIEEYAKDLAETQFEEADHDF